MFSGFDKIDQKELEKKHLESEDPETEYLELAEIIDIQSIQSLMNDFYKLVHIPIRLNDLNGKVLIGVGWQDICTKFHWVHPKACKHCVESNTNLSKDLVPGEFRLYKCKNNMWDIVTPIMIGSQRVGYIFAGQFFFDDEPLDYKLFKNQARKYCFNEEEYIAALEKVPRLSREAVDTGMSFFMAFANMLSQLSYSNTMLAKSLSERDALVTALRISESKYRNIIETAREGIWLLDSNNRTIFVNQMTSEILGYSIEELLGQLPQKFLAPEFREVVDERLIEHRQRANKAIDYRFIRKDGSDLWCILSTSPLFDDEGKYAGSLGMLTDITERKLAEKALKENETRFRALAENSPDIITRFDREYRHVYGNPAYVESYNISLDEIIGKTQGELGRDTKKVKFWEEHLENTFITGKIETLDYYISLQGKKHYFNAKIVPELTDGKVISVLSISRDITDIKEAEAKLKVTLENLEILVKKRTADLETAFNSLKESEKGLAEAQRMAHFGNWVWDIATDKAYWSEEMYHIFKRRPLEAAPSFNEFLNYIHTEDRHYFTNDSNKTVIENLQNVDFRIILHEGEERIVYMQSEVIFDEVNIPIRMKGTVQDITDRKRAEKALQKSEEQYRTLFNSMVEGFTIIEMLFDEYEKPIDYVFVEVNPSFEKQTGLSDVVGKKVSELIPTNEEYWFEIYGNVALTGKPVRFENYVEGLQRWYEVYSYRIGQPFNRKIAIIFNDITKRKLAEEKLRESEEKYRYIVETANEGITITDAEAKITYVNMKMEDLMGYSQEELIGKHIWDFNNEDDKPMAKLNMERKRQSVNDSLETKLKRKDGLPLWANINSKSIFDNTGVFIGAINMLTDITKRKQAEEELNNIEIARKKEIHHRIKNNLQVISSLLDLQADKFRNRKNISNSEVLEAFRESQDRVISMALIHEELYRGGGFEKLNFSPYVEELSDNLLKSYSLGNKNIDLHLNLDNNAFFDMDVAVPLGMIINELVSNSFKHAFKGRDDGEIQIKLHRKENGAYLNTINESLKSTTFDLVISDNGVGIPENLNIEELDSLGLQLVISLVSQLDGDLEIKRNKGTEFIIRFTTTEKNNRTSAPITQNLFKNTMS